MVLESVSRGNHTPDSRTLQLRLRLAIAQAKYWILFQLTHTCHVATTLSQSLPCNGSQREDKKLLQPSQLCQHGEFQCVSISERQQSQPCGHVPFLTPVLQKSKRVLEQWRQTVRQKRLYLKHQGEFWHQNCTGWVTT